MGRIIITTSWDDNHPKNIKLVDLLNKYDLKGTFYLDQRNFSNIAKIASFQEIGAHTLTHPKLAEIGLEQAKREIVNSKKWLEEEINRPVEMFAYPFGSYNKEVKKIVKQAGFLGARTTKEFCFQKPKDFFTWGTTVHVYPFPLRKKNANHYHLSRFLFQPLSQKFFKILGLPFSSFFSWRNLAKNIFDHACQQGGIYHLWGHAFELDKYGMWEDLEEVFKYISRRKDVLYLTNSQILK